MKKAPAKAETQKSGRGKTAVIPYGSLAHITKGLDATKQNQSREDSRSDDDDDWAKHRKPVLYKGTRPNG